MRSFLLSYRLKQLSRDITKQTFSDTTERVDAEALKQAQFMLYSDMLQYAEDEPDADYRVIYEHFVDETLKHPSFPASPEENFVWHSRCMCGHFTCWIHDSPANFGGKS